jgi:hypothetical protein
MKVKKTLLVSILLFSFSYFANAQDHEVGVFLGTSNYQGDLTERHLTLRETRPAFGALYRYYFSPRLNFKANFNYGWIAGDDENYADIPDRWRRNLHFRSHIAELAANVELNILPFVAGSQKFRWTPYIYVGIAGYNFKPQAEFKGEWVDLQPLGTEGQLLDPEEDPYPLTQIAIPYGVGIKLNISGLWNIGLEFGQRKLFTDYLDDVSTRYPDLDKLAAQNSTARALSERGNERGPQYAWQTGNQRGNPDRNDMYVWGGITITRTIRRFSCIGF